jgi:hypothetical protein
MAFPAMEGNWMRRYKGRIVAAMCLASKADDHGHRAEWWIEVC